MLIIRISAILVFLASATLHAQKPNEDSVYFEKKELSLIRVNQGGEFDVTMPFPSRFLPDMVVVQAHAELPAEIRWEVMSYASPRDPRGNLLWGQGRFLYHPLGPDEHSAQKALTSFTPVLLPEQFDAMRLVGRLPEGMNEVQLTIWYFHIPKITLVFPAADRRNSCASPAIIPQSVWRTGLDAPVPGRTATPTHHCIVHHSAGNTHDTDFTKVVRAYYVYHTTVNGWDDIGYNYLVGPDGKVFAGRDPEKPEIRQDEVVGAHFCAKNTYTMGVCVIGDYMKERPSTAAMDALTALLRWKVAKDTLNPLGAFPHPWPSGGMLASVAGHRDGCSTACPGDSLYILLSGLRQDLLPCYPALPRRSVSAEQATMLFYGRDVVVSGFNGVADISIFDAAGRLQRRVQRRAGESLTLSIPGVNVLRVQLPDGRIISGRTAID